MEAIESYCRFHFINAPYERDRFLRYIESLDRAWMSDHYKKQQDKQPSGSTTTDPTKLDLTRPKR